MNFEAVIGLEIHVEMKTKSKMFSSAPINFSDEPNTDTTYLDFAFPGTMPVVNKEAVRKAIQMCNALHMEIDDELWFDRKNYFYSDLPKGYQITQQARPIGKNGYLEIEIDGEKRKIGIERLHMEEDTCKQTHFNDYTLLDYNRAGIPLIEIVSLPVMHTGLEARKYVEKIREFVTFSGVSDGKMEEGSLRCDVNISLRPYGSDKFGTKVEIKNLNSIANIEKAIDYEILRQSRLLFKGEDIIQETRRFDEAKKETILMRVKTDAVDYKYFTEPNITPIKLSKEIPNSFIPSQFENDYNALSHYETTSREILDALDNKIDVFIAGFGTGGTISGCAKRFKEVNNKIHIIGVEPLSSPLLTKGKAGPHKLQGIGANFIPKLLNRSLIDEVIDISDDDAYFFTNELALVEGIFAGITSGASLAAAVNLNNKIYKGKNIVIILPDNGERYLSVEHLYD